MSSAKQMSALRPHVNLLQQRSSHPRQNKNWRTERKTYYTCKCHCNDCYTYCKDRFNICQPVSVTIWNILIMLFSNPRYNWYNLKPDVTIIVVELQWVSRIWASLTWLRFELCGLKLISTTAPAASKMMLASKVVKINSKKVISLR